MATLQSLNEVLKSVKSLIVDEQGHPDAIANAARTVLMQKVCSRSLRMRTVSKSTVKSNNKPWGAHFRRGLLLEGIWRFKMGWA